MNVFSSLLRPIVRSLRGKRRSFTSTATSAMLIATIVPVVVFFSSARAEAQTAFAPGDLFLAAANGTVAQVRPPVTTGRTDTLTSGASTTSDAGGMCLDAVGNLYVSIPVVPNQVAKFAPTGALVSASWASYTNIGNGGQGTGCAIDSSGNVYVANNKVITKLNSQGTKIAEWALTGVGNNGVLSIGLKHDQCTLLYDDYSNRVRTFNVCTGTQSADFATGLNGTCYEMIVRSDDTVVASCDEWINALSPTGAVTSSYHIGNYAASFTSVTSIAGTNSVWIGDYINRNMRILDVGSGGTSNLFYVDVRPWLTASYSSWAPTDGPLTPLETLGLRHPAASCSSSSIAAAAGARYCGTCSAAMILRDTGSPESGRSVTPDGGRRRARLGISATPAPAATSS